MYVDQNVGRALMSYFDEKFVQARVLEIPTSYLLPHGCLKSPVPSSYYCYNEPRELQH